MEPVNQPLRQLCNECFKTYYEDNLFEVKRFVDKLSEANMHSLPADRKRVRDNLFAERKRFHNNLWAEWDKRFNTLNHSDQHFQHAIDCSNQHGMSPERGGVVSFLLVKTKLSRSIMGGGNPLLPSPGLMILLLTKTRPLYLWLPHRLPLRLPHR